MINAMATVTTLEAAHDYLSRGWMPVPVPLSSKAPVLSGWQHLRLEQADLPQYFADAANIGLLLGNASAGLVDIDLDSREAQAVASTFLCTTGLVHGRASKPCSHWWYLANPVPETTRFLAPDGTCLAELRSTGGQTIVPPSTHPSGEVIRWHASGSPSKIRGDDLRTAVARLAACALLAKCWPAKGARHEAALAAGGILLRGGLSEELAVTIVETAAQIAGDEEWRSRGNDVRDTASKLAAGKAVTGGPTLAELLDNGDKAVAKLRDWLGLQQTGDGATVWYSPLPFFDQHGPPFPVGALPDCIRGFVEAQAVALQVPPDLISSLVFGVGAAAGAGRCVVRLNEEWAEPLNLFVVVALPSGERKSPAFRAVTAPLEERECDLAMAARPDIEMRKAERDVLDKQLQIAKNMAAKAKEENRDAQMGEVAALVKNLAEFEVPSTPRLLADDATSEAVASLLSEQSGRIAIMSTEGGLFETLAGRYAEGVLNIDVYLKGYSGDTLRIDRKSRPPEFVPKPALTLCLTVQPDVIRDLAGKRGFRGRGLLARFLYSIPRSLVGYRSNTAPPVQDLLRKHWYRIIRDIVKLPDPPEGNEHALRLSPEAYAAFQDFRDQVEKQLRPGEELSDIADWGNKLPGNVARLAGILHLFTHAGEVRPWEIAISGATIEAAIQFGDYYVAHANIAFSLMGADPEAEKAHRLWASILHYGFKRFTQRDLYLKVRRRFDVDEIGKVLRLLGDMGYVRRLDTEPSTGPGRPPSPTYEINPLACTQKPQNPAAQTISEDFEDSVYTSVVEGREEAGRKRVSL